MKKRIAAAIFAMAGLLGLSAVPAQASTGYMAKSCTLQSLAAGKFNVTSWINDNGTKTYHFALILNTDWRTDFVLDRDIRKYWYVREGFHTTSNTSRDDWSGNAIKGTYLTSRAGCTIYDI